MAVMGPSGAGKSTLQHLCVAQRSPVSGDVRVIDGERSASLGNFQLSDITTNIGYVSADMPLIPEVLVGVDEPRLTQRLVKWGFPRP